MSLIITVHPYSGYVSWPGQKLLFYSLYVITYDSKLVVICHGRTV